MPASLPVQRTLEALRKEGWTADVAEKWVAIPGPNRCPSCGQARPRPGMPPGIRRDLHGFVDVDAFHPEKGHLYVQCSDDAGGMAKHVTKLLGEDLAPKVERALRAGCRVEIHAWGKRGPRGKVKHWTRRRLVFTLVSALDGYGLPALSATMVGPLAYFEQEGAP